MNSVSFWEFSIFKLGNLKVQNHFKTLYNLALDLAETSRLNKILHKKLEEVQDTEVQIDMRSDPRSPLFSSQTFETLNL
jgi:hypothetical protein